MAQDGIIPKIAVDGISGVGAFADPQPDTGPIFVDTGSCRCALQADGAQASTWRCLGDARQLIHDQDETGLFFKTKTGKKLGDLPNRPLNDDSEGVDTSTAYVFIKSKLVPLDPANNKTLSANDRACTGKNNTAGSERYYEIVREIRDGQKPPPAAAVCLTGSLPMQIQDAGDWEAQGCPVGFLCPNNTINSLPQYCVPPLQAQEARLAGQNTPAMGIYEPQICWRGNYCPPGAKEMVICPKGSFCPVGSQWPIPCTGAASCPEGSTYNQPIVPVILLFLWNVVLISVFLFAKWYKRRGQHRTEHKSGMLSQLNKNRSTISSLADISNGHRHSSLGTPGLETRSRANSLQSLNSHDDGYEMDARVSFSKPEGEDFLTATSFPDDAAGMYNAKSEDGTDLDAFVASLSRCIQGSSFGLTFQFSNLSYQPRGSSKTILSGVSGKINSGSLVGVMGGSGAGKSTFVNVLMGKLPHTSGETKINGVTGRNRLYKKIIGYVPQDDILLSEMTVRENILHSARVRLPRSWSDSDIQKHVDILLDCLKLAHVKDNIVGTVGKPGVSGGQRKRVSIGMELAAAPMALFLDEPTSGLDATAASSIMELLKALSRLGITIVTIIHQPRQEIFESLDELVLLGLGRMIFEGPTSGVSSYFSDCGFHFPNNQNPADVIMDIINGEGRHYKRVGDTSIAALIENWAQRQSSVQSVPTIVPPQEEVDALRRSIRARGAPLWKQIWLCLARAVVQQYRAAQSFWFEMGVATLAGILIGLAENGEHGENFRGFYRGNYAMLSSSMDVNSIGQLALLVGIAIGLVAASPAVKVFGEEKLMFYREAAAGHNRFAYYIGKVISTLPRMALGCAHFTTLFMLLATPRMRWLESMVANFLYFWCIYGLASVVSMVTRREDGPLLAVMATLIVGTLCGMAPTLKTVEGWHMGWLWRMSPGTWLSEYYYNQNVIPWRAIYDIEATTTGAVGFSLDNSNLDLIILTVIGVIYRIIAFLAMRFLNRARQR